MVIDLGSGFPGYLWFREPTLFARYSFPKLGPDLRWYFVEGSYGTVDHAITE